MVKGRNVLFSLGVIAALAIGGVYGADWWERQQYIVTTDNAYVRAHLTVISPEIDAHVETVHVVANDFVRAGDILVTFSASSYEAAVDTARAELAAAEADLTNGQASIENVTARRQLQHALIAQADARLASERAAAEQAGRDLERYERLMERQTGSRQKFEEALTARRQATAAVARAEAEQQAAREALTVIDSEMGQMDADIARRQAMVARAEARLDQAELALSDTLVISPVDGFIGNRKVEPGMYMEAGWPMMSVIPTSEIWVTANFKETQVRRLRSGQIAELRIDAFPDQPVEGRVDSLGAASAAEFSLLPAQNAAGNFVKVVQRIPVRILFDVPPALEGRIVPGMSVIVTVDTQTAPEGGALASTVAAVPNQE